MGSSNGKPHPSQLLNNYNPQHWRRTVPSSPAEPTLWHNILTNETAMPHPLTKMPSHSDLPTYQFRSQHPDVVKVHCLAVDDNASMCHQAKQTNILVEHIPLTLQQVTRLEQQEAVTILASCLRGFQALQSHFQACIDPRPQLIGFNSWGKCKVWVSPEYHHIDPPHVPTHTPYREQLVSTSSISKIIDLIEQKLPTGLPVELAGRLKNKVLSYEEASNVVEDYSVESGMSLQRYLRMDLQLRQISNQQSKFTFNQERPPRVINYNQESQARRVNSPVPTASNTQATMKRIYSVGRLAQPGQVSRTHINSPLHHDQSHSHFGSGTIPNAVFSRSIVQDNNQTPIRPQIPHSLPLRGNVSFKIQPPPTLRYNQPPLLTRNSSTPALQKQPSFNIAIPPPSVVNVSPMPPNTLVAMVPVHKINSQQQMPPSIMPSTLQHKEQLQSEHEVELNNHNSRSDEALSEQRDKVEQHRRQLVESPKKHVAINQSEVRFQAAMLESQPTSAPHLIGSNEVVETRSVTSEQEEVPQEQEQPALTEQTIIDNINSPLQSEQHLGATAVFPQVPLQPTEVQERTILQTFARQPSQPNEIILETFAGKPHAPPSIVETFSGHKISQYKQMKFVSFAPETLNNAVSFAPEEPRQANLVSFAPEHTKNSTQFEREERLLQTSKSLECNEPGRFDQAGITRMESIQQRIPHSGTEKEVNQQNNSEPEEDPVASSGAFPSPPDTRKRISIDQKIQPQVVPTRVESKFHIKRNSELSQPEHSRQEHQQSTVEPLNLHNSAGKRPTKKEEDFLDVGFLERSLDKRYSRRPSKTPPKDEEDMSVASLESGLMKFESSRLTQRNNKDLTSRGDPSKLSQQSKETPVKHQDSSNHPVAVSAVEEQQITLNDVHNHGSSSISPPLLLKDRFNVPITVNYQSALDEIDRSEGPKKKSVRVEEKSNRQYSYELGASGSSDAWQKPATRIRQERNLSSTFSQFRQHRVTPERSNRRKMTQQADLKLEERYSKYVKGEAKLGVRKRGEGFGGVAGITARTSDKSEAKDWAAASMGNYVSRKQYSYLH